MVLSARRCSPALRIIGTCPPESFLARVRDICCASLKLLRRGLPIVERGSPEARPSSSSESASSSCFALSSSTCQSGCMSSIALFSRRAPPPYISAA